VWRVRVARCVVAGVCVCLHACAGGPFQCIDFGDITARELRDSTVSKRTASVGREVYYCVCA
jgi:hypothetical protein